jgi:hypothetical protein
MDCQTDCVHFVLFFYIHVSGFDLYPFFPLTTRHETSVFFRQLDQHSFGVLGPKTRHV